MPLRKYSAAKSTDRTTHSDGFVTPRGTEGETSGGVTIDVGSTTTGDAGTQASVTNSGSNTEVVLDFVIPKGEDGVDGNDAPSPNFTASVETMNSEQNAGVVLTGTYPNLNLEFQIPRGQDGMGTISVGTTTTLPAGSSAYVSNSGTPQDAVLNFGIPQGADGGGGGYGIEEAPMDGSTYGRNNGSWTSVSGGTGGGGIEEAPNDGTPYVRFNGYWAPLSNFIT